MARDPEARIAELEAELASLRGNNVQQFSGRFNNGDLVRHDGEVYTVVGRGVTTEGDPEYNLGHRTADGWDLAKFDIAEADLEPTTLVEHHYNGEMIGHIEAEELDRIHRARASGAMIGLERSTTGMTRELIDPFDQRSVGAVDGVRTSDRR